MDIGMGRGTGREMEIGMKIESGAEIRMETDMASGLPYHPDRSETDLGGSGVDVGRREGSLREGSRIGFPDHSDRSETDMGGLETDVGCERGGSQRTGQQDRRFRSPRSV